MWRKAPEEQSKRFNDKENNALPSIFISIALKAICNLYAAKICGLLACKSARDRKNDSLWPETHTQRSVCLINNWGSCKTDIEIHQRL